MLTIKIRSGAELRLTEWKTMENRKTVYTSVVWRSDDPAAEVPWVRREFYNLTGHTVVYDLGDGRRISFPPSGQEWRLEEEDEDTQLGVYRTYHSVRPPIYCSNMSLETYIVPALVLLHEATTRAGEQLVAPDTGSGAFRDVQGRVTAVCRWLTGPPRS
jgi:hypothetical protein